jgi:hypothetical protein
MAFDVSKITSAVNSYLYSISDMNKLMNGDTSENSSTLSGFFQKYLNKALGVETNDTTAVLDSVNSMDNISDTDVSKALSALNSISATGVSGSNYDAYASDALISSVLPDLTGSSSLTNASSNISDTVQESGIGMTFPDLEAEIKSAFSGMDLNSQIQQNISNHDRSNEIKEFSNYNASRIASYKTKKDATSVFGDFRL